MLSLHKQRIMQQKTCNKCKILKNLSEYTFSSFTKFGVRNTCKECRKIERKEYINRPYVREKSKKYYQNNKETFRKRMNEHYHTLNGQYHQYKKAAKKRNIIFNLTQEDCVNFYNTSCSYCGDTVKDLGIDRIDSNIGYTVTNSVSCCSTCNYMKHVLSIKDFMLHIKKIINHYEKN